MITIKKPEEIERMRVAGRITRDVLNYVEAILKEGMTTKDVDKLAFEFI